MTLLEGPIDDTVHLDYIKADMEGRDFTDFPPNQDDVEILGSENHEKESSEDDTASFESRHVSKRNMAGVAILTLVNLLNYMDRFTIAGVLPDIQKDFNINNSESGLIQTSFIVSYMLLSPVFGYLGDRYNRKLLMGIGIAFWSAVTLAGSFVPKDHFWAFVMLRGAVGVGEASYSTIAPTLIADLFVKDQRSKALAIFYFAIPVGSGLGYIVGAQVAAAFGGWHWALRVTPGLGLVCVILILFVLKEPTRGAAEGGSHLGHTTWCADLAYLVKNKSFITSSLGFTAVAFVAGALSLWAPTFMLYAYRINGNDTEDSTVALIFGVITCLAGFLGVAIGSESARRIRKVNPRADPLVCAFGLLSCAPFLYLALVLSRYNIYVTWVLIFIGETLLCLNWAIVTDIVLYVVIPTRRSTAEAFQIMLSHALGDAGSPYLVGLMSDSITANLNHEQGLSQKNTVTSFVGLQYSLYMTCFVAVLGGGAFLATSLFIEADRAELEKIVKGSNCKQTILSGVTETISVSDHSKGEETLDTELQMDTSNGLSMIENKKNLNSSKQVHNLNPQLITVHL